MLTCQLSVHGKLLLKSHRKGMHGLLKITDKIPFSERCSCFVQWLLHLCFLCRSFCLPWNHGLGVLGCKSLGAVMEEQHGLDKLYLTRLFRWRLIGFVLYPWKKSKELLKWCNIIKQVSAFIINLQILLTPLCKSRMRSLQALLLIGHRSYSCHRYNANTNLSFFKCKSIYLSVL